MPSLAQAAVVIARFRIVEYAEQESVSAAARRFDCSHTTVHTLQKRFRGRGPADAGQSPPRAQRADASAGPQP